MSTFDASNCERFITGRDDFQTGNPPVGNTGDCERSVTGRLDLEEYAEAEATRIFLTTYNKYSTPTG